MFEVSNSTSTALRWWSTSWRKRTEIEVKLVGVHLCCQGCVNAADAALMSVEGVDSRCDMEHATVTLTARDDDAARNALSALAAAGFYGTSDNQNLAVKPVGTLPIGKVNRVQVSGIHNCCDLCCDAIQDAIRTVEGVTGDTVKPGVTSFVVTGNFEAASLVKALNAAGFSALVEPRHDHEVSKARVRH
jgi:copper chaperone CopZ